MLNLKLIYLCRISRRDTASILRPALPALWFVAKTQNLSPCKDVIALLKEDITGMTSLPDLHCDQDYTDQGSNLYAHIIPTLDHAVKAQKIPRRRNESRDFDAEVCGPSILHPTTYNVHFSYSFVLSAYSLTMQATGMILLTNQSRNFSLSSTC